MRKYDVFISYRRVGGKNWAELSSLRWKAAGRKSFWILMS